MIWSFLAALSLGIWLYLLLGRGGFWREGVLPPAPEPECWPRVVAVVPARNEAATIGTAVASLLAQDYPGKFSVLLVDDHSEDDTAAIARRAAAGMQAGNRLRVQRARPLPKG